MLLDRIFVPKKLQQLTLIEIVRMLIAYELEYDMLSKLYDLVQNNGDYFGARPGDQKLEVVYNYLKDEIDSYYGR